MASAGDHSRGSTALTTCYDAALGNLDVPFESQVIPTRFGNTHLITAGDENREPIILLHGAASSAAACWPLINVHARNHHLVAIDIPGHLGRTAPFKLSPRGHDFAHWMTDILDNLMISQAYFIGFSYGAWVTLKLAAVASDRIKKAILINPVGVAPFRFSYWLRVPFLLMMALLDPSGRSVNGLARLLAGPTAPQPVVDLMADDGRVFIQNFRMPAMPLRISRKALQYCQFPVLVLLGQFDSICNPDVVRSRLRGYLPDGHVEIIADAGHALIYEQTGMVNARIQDFFHSET